MATNKPSIKNTHIGTVEPGEYGVYLANDKEKKKFVSRIERIVRSSMEYKDYIAYLKDYMDMTKCAFFNNVTNTDHRKVRIEIHHEPFTLMDITVTVLTKWINEGIPLNDLLIADEIMSIHFTNRVGLIPLSQTVHEVVHNNSNVVIPLYLVYGNYKDFVAEYHDYFSDELMEKIERKIEMTKMLRSSSFEIFNTEFEYIDVDGFQLIEKIGSPDNE